MTLDRRFRSTYDDLLSHLPAVRDGNVNAIHDARVATRRLRALMRVLAAGQPSEERKEEWKEATRVVRRTGRALGKARDIDTSLDLLAELESRSPLTAPAAAAYRAVLLPRQTAARRKLIKRLESIAFEPLERMAVGHQTRRRALMWSRAQHVGRHLAQLLAEHALTAREAIDRASGVYFARRTHLVRVALKHLRYALELSEERKTRRRELRLLKRAQEALGQIHDRQMLLDDVERAVRKHKVEIPSVDMLTQVLEAECRTLYAKYLEVRKDVLELCEAIGQWSAWYRVRRLRNSMLTMSLVALPSAAVVVLARQTASRALPVSSTSPRPAAPRRSEAARQLLHPASSLRT